MVQISNRLYDVRFPSTLISVHHSDPTSIMNAIKTPNINTFNIPKICKQTPLLYIQVVWTVSVIYKQYKFVLKVKGFVRDET